MKQSVACKFVYAGSPDNVGCINTAGQILSRDLSKDVWTAVPSHSTFPAPPAFEKLAVSSNGRGAALTATGELYFRIAWKSAFDGWVMVPGKTWANVGISATHIVGTTTAGEIFWLNHTK